ncbi:MAG: Ig-like domain-containing protein, partial [Cyclobacteriaceae bacterium]
TNNGPSDATGVEVVDALPDGYSYVSNDGGASESAGTVTWSIGALANGASSTLNITATVLASGSYSNSATVSGDQDDPGPGPNTDTPDDPVVPVPQADLQIVKTIDDDTPDVGDDITFTLVVTNNGPSDATGVEVVDALPDGYSYVSNDGGASESAGTVTWSIGALANGASSTLNITATVLASGSYSNSATVSGDQDDPGPGPNTDTPDDPVVPVPQADLSISKAINNLSPNVGDEVDFTITVTNNGPSAATNVIATDDLPTGYTFVSSNATSGLYDETTGDWTLGAMANGAEETLTITVTVNAVGDYNNTATVTSDTDDPDPTPGDEEDTVIVNPINNNPPVAVNDTFTIDEDTPAMGNLIQNDSDPDGDNLIINTTPIVSPGNGTLVINPDGTFTYTPDEDFVGEDSFTYQICDDGTPSKCTEAVVTINVEENRSISIEVDEVCLSNVPYVEYTVTATGFTPEDEATITWKKLDGTVAEQLTNQPLTGMLLWPGAAVDSDGNPTDWPGWDLVGGVWVQIEDGLRPELTLEISINPTNSVQVFYPPATPTCSANPNNPPEPKDDSYETDSENPVTANLLDNDSDPDDDDLTVNITPVNGPNNGTLVINSNGTFTYTPDEDFVGTDSFTYEVCDDGVPSKCAQATVTIVVMKPNSPPVPVTTEIGPVQNCIWITGNVLDYVSDADNDNLVVGAIPVVDPQYGNLVMSSDGSFTYTPDEGYVGEDSFSYQVCDDADNQKCAVGVVTIEVIAPLDTDGDTLLDCDEMGDPDDPEDTDDDGIPDFEDPDDDGDGIPTVEELDDPEDDCDDDGIPNYLDPAQFSCGELPVTSTITPNNDGYNDFLKILGLDEFSENYIVVYNRWGNIVFEVKNYVSDPGSPKSFVGVANTTNSSNNVPDGTYFYVLKLVRNGKERVQKGSFEIRN